MPARRNYNVWTPEQRAYLEAMRARGVGAAEIASAMGLTLSQVNNKIREWQIPLASRPEAKETPAPGPSLPPAPALQPPDPIEEMRARQERTRALRDEREALEAVAGERSLRGMLDALFREVTPRVDPPPPYREPKVKKHLAIHETAVLALSDWHYGEVVKAERVRDFNAYDQEIAATRVRQLVTNARGILSNLRTGGYAFDRLVVAVNGDLVTGTIHELEKHSNGKTIVESVVECGSLLAEAIRDLSADFPRVDVFCTVGNHGRFPDQRRMEQKAPLRNWDALVYHFARVACETIPTVTFTIPDAYAVGYEIDGHCFLQQHGHDIKSWAGIPWYGIQRYTSRIVALEASRDRRASFFLFGHFHTAASLPQPGGELFINGSLIGATEYSVNALGAADRPTQWLLGVHPEHGVTHRWPVYSDPRRTKGAA